MPRLRFIPRFLLDSSYGLVSGPSGRFPLKFPGNQTVGICCVGLSAAFGNTNDFKHAFVGVCLFVAGKLRSMCTVY